MKQHLRREQDLHAYIDHRQLHGNCGKPPPTAVMHQGLLQNPGQTAWASNYYIVYLAPFTEKNKKGEKKSPTAQSSSLSLQTFPQVSHFHWGDCSEVR